MSTIAAAPFISRPSTSNLSATLSRSPSDDLALTLAGINLADDCDDNKEEDDRVQGSSLSEILKGISANLSQIRNQFFIIQERRHAGVFALAKQSNNGSISKLASPSSARNDQEAESSVALDMAMAKLNALLESISEGMKAADAQISAVQSNEEFRGPSMSVSPRRRTGSIASLSSLDSFDDAFGEINIVADTPQALTKRYEEISIEWVRVQAEAKSLEEELSGDKYLLIFTSTCDEMEGMMDSLDKALAICHDFIFAFHRERAENILNSSESQWESSKERLADLMAIKRSFDVKKSSYGPACEQMFITMEKGLKQRSTQNGTILRQLVDLKTRWRVLRERVSKTDKDIKRIEVELMRAEDVWLSPSKSSPERIFLTPPRDERRPKSRLRSKNESATNTPTRMNRSISTSDVYNESSALLPSDLNSKALPVLPGSSLSPRSAIPIKPPKSVNRHSYMAPKASTSTPQTHSRSFSSTASFALPSPNTRSTSRVTSYGAPPTSSRTMEPTRSISGGNANVQNRSPVARLKQVSRAGSEPPEQSSIVSRWRQREQSTPPSRPAVGEESMLDLGDVTISSNTTLQNRPSSALGLQIRPPSATGSYYRPPSASGHRTGTEGKSRIPRLSTGPTSRRMEDASSSYTGDRPGSALSLASSAAYGRSPSSKVSYTRSQYPPSSFHGSHDRGNRLSMQTPEPTIAARAQRMNLFAPKTATKKTPAATTPAAKRSSRPPPAKYNFGLHGGGPGSVNGGSSSLSHSASPPSSSATSASPYNYRSLNSTTPLTISKRGSMAWSSTGRTTPLSAAALAKVPLGGPDLGEHVQGNVSAANGSVKNFRSQRVDRTSVGPRSYTPSVLSGRATPTFSEGGGSSVWGGGIARRLAATYSYRPNPNDAIDVAVADVVNSLGVAIERVDPPLPKGVKDLNPSSSKVIRYEVGGKVIVCKLLQLHRPASVYSNQDKTDKVLTRVGGGYIDLRQYLLSRMGTS